VNLAHSGAVTLQQLRVFTAAAREGSFARAAEGLSLSEPNVSTHFQAATGSTCCGPTISPTSLNASRSCAGGRWHTEPESN
jgi:hypothetical protein